ncbi:iron-containing alcohol dehydrogenase [uncultured Sunxiuqinia sp.]|uniref:iron-containing alcohol dehydrogenase n=1 Tax=uncultured Sunxiuqinia sp. TaxID=1573825 RepID=UPI002AA94F16|nr:iron-containing alcohol dehydrogenase [uncultured Sunxiuqinia sp.]
MNRILLQQPSSIVFGEDSLVTFTEDYLNMKHKSLYLLTISPVLPLLGDLLKTFEKEGIRVEINTGIEGEPSFRDFEKVLLEARNFGADSVVGIGGGSVLDVAKFLAAMLKNDQNISDVIGIGLLKERRTYLACLPTTSGTGSEVSPNAIFLDEKDGGKKGVISPFLVPDGAYIDPALTVGVPAAVTAATGIDALTHCLEAYVNRFAHPVVDLWALEGIRLISQNLEKSCIDGNDIDARTAVALGSVYGGMCLGPVNTAAVHALAYPLGSIYEVPHGLSNALLLPYVMEYNMPEGNERLAGVAKALGVTQSGADSELALAGVLKIKELIAACGLPSRLSEIDIKKEDIEKMADAAILVQRLLNNNVKELTKEDIVSIYKKAY